jgi:hypothetical protein
MSANEERGEFGISLGGADYVLRPSFEAIQAFERPVADGGTGKSLIQLAGEADRGAMTMATTAVIIAECIRAWGKAVGNTGARGAQADVIGPMLVEAGVYIVQPKLAVLLYMAATGGLTATGEVKQVANSAETMAGADGSAVSPAPRSGGARKTSGKPRP